MTHSLNDQDRISLGDLGIRTVIDLRSNGERQGRPHGLLGWQGIQYWAHDHDRIGGNLTQVLANPDLETGHLHTAMLELYRQLPYDFIEAYRQIFLTVASGQVPLVFNCAAGKDRTGAAAALLLAVLGVAWEDILADYMLTEQFVPDIVRAFRASETSDRLGRLGPDAVATLFGVAPIYLEAMRESLIERSGSLENYLLTELNLPSIVLETVRARLLY
jgi:protein-tyrosine phosphatase